MPIYEYYCPDNHKIYQFYAKTLAQGQRVPRCPDNPKLRMVKLISPFAVTGKARDAADGAPAGAAAGGPPEDARLEAAMGSMEREFANVDENDPRAMGRMMRRMAELTGEPVGGEMEEVVRKLEEGADPDSLEDSMGGLEGEAAGPGPDAGTPAASGGGPPAKRRARSRFQPPERDPGLYDYD
jgi:hypothetical protein